MNKRLAMVIYSLVGALLTYLALLAWQGKIPFTFVEYMGFVSGAICVWLAARDNVWNWPIGIINAGFFTVLFFNARLFADMGLQVVYIILGFLGWYWWLRGGSNKTELPISHISKKEIITLSILTILCTIGMTQYLHTINDSAPFADALTTVTSLVAQYLLTKKRLENWYVWIGTDVIYIWLYAHKGLYLTSVLYAVFLLMCISGVVEWKNKLQYSKSRS
jgi:nicotinamide mononucleotide transporter